MRKNSYRIYAVLILGLMLLFSIPNQVQQTLRNQFLRPLLPFAHLIPFKSTKMPKRYPSKKIALLPPPESSYPNSSVAKIIYRNPSTWSDFFWINLGENSNKDEVKVVINSPVLYNGALIGLVDYVGEKQARVQLITNTALTISVRVLRGKSQYESIAQEVDHLLSLNLVQNQKLLLQELTKLKKNLEEETLDWYLAKGELSGTSLPLWRSKSHILMGRGFNCEFADEYGVQRDLVTGRIPNGPEVNVPIIQTDDLLVTTGLDGVIPEGLEVARVSAVDPLREGACSYTLKADPIIHNLSDLSFVEVILPTEYRNIKTELRAFTQN